MSQIILRPRPTGATLTRWLYDEIRAAIMSGRLRRGSRLPASREFAAQQGVSRHIVVNVFDQLIEEGYLTGRVGFGAESVFLLGSFNKTMFPSLRLGYMVVPDAWIDRVLAQRYRSDRYPPTMSQEVMAAFLEDGHFGRHLRRMREIYGARHAILECYVERYLKGVLKLPEIQAGLNTPAFLVNGMSARNATELAAQQGVEAWPIDRYTIRRRDLRAIMLGFAAFNEKQIRTGVQSLAKALDA
jgi:DNA-binding transcriptional MocR family regulator